MSDSWLSHTGVKGMRWGVRKERKEALALRRKTIRDLSDKDLKVRVDRLNLEKQYAQLLSEMSSSKRSAISKFVSAALNRAATKAVDKTLEKMIDAALGIKTQKKKSVVVATNTKNP